MAVRRVLFCRQHNGKFRTLARLRNHFDIAALPRYDLAGQIQANANALLFVYFFLTIKAPEDSGQPLSGWFSLKSILPKRGSAFYINGVISGFSHGREPLQLLLFWSFAHGSGLIKYGGDTTMTWPFENDTSAIVKKLAKRNVSSNR